MNVPVEHNLHSCSRLFRFLLPLFPNETLLRLSVTRLTSAVTRFTGSAAAAAATRTNFFSDAHADVPRVVSYRRSTSSLLCLNKRSNRLRRRFASCSDSVYHGACLLTITTRCIIGACLSNSALSPRLYLSTSSLTVPCILFRVGDSLTCLQN